MLLSHSLDGVNNHFYIQILIAIRHTRANDLPEYFIVKSLSGVNVGRSESPSKLFPTATLVLAFAYKLPICIQ